MSLESDVASIRNATYGQQTRAPIVDALTIIEDRYSDIEITEIVTTKFSDFSVQQNTSPGDYTLVVNPVGS